ncbi:MAG TPA: 3-methyl-2-oxobutanoate dehydrogenase subunit VorB [Dissulfurispiraceae bacterium]|nr:3-methyl-2-oxobutanoate dehydrogenase subunit VorB [Dissulfurispiraceae bacterium]
MKKVLMKGNEAIAEAAVQSGCRFYAGYPITPQNEIPEYLSWRMEEVNGVFIQAESELAAVNMVYGAAACGVRAMTSSSSPGISLKMETISHLAAARLPAVIVNVQRGGPGLGNISASQSDYFQAVKGGGHGDYHMLVLAPFSVQELWDMTMTAFDKADEYRIPVMILTDGVMAQMMEPLMQTPYIRPQLPEKDWALTGCSGRSPNVVRTLFMGEGELADHNLILQDTYRQLKEREVRNVAYDVGDADVILVAHGVAARIALSAMGHLRKLGRRVGLFRPQTLYPFPEKQLSELAVKGRRMVVVELNAGQMVEDVRLAVNGKADVDFIGRMGGLLITPEELAEEIVALVNKRDMPAS